MKITKTIHQYKARCPVCSSTIDLHEITENDELYYNHNTYITHTP